MTAQTDDTVLAKVQELLAPFNANGIEITRETVIASDLDIDSVAIMNLIMEMEDTYDISFPMTLIAEIKSVGELVDTVHKLKEDAA